MFGYQNSPGSCITAALATAGVLGTAYCTFRYYQINKLPRNWTHVGSLANFYVYPIKSCAAVEVETAECTFMGLKNGWLRDRVLMVVDDSNNFITARGYPELLLVDPTVRRSILTVRHANMEPLYVNLAEVIATGQSQRATVWGCTVPVYDCGQEASDWFTKALDREDMQFRLVYYSLQECREFRNEYMTKVFKFRETDTGALPDEASFNLINNASIDELNSRLTITKIDHRWFRPNFTIEGAAPYDEDNWKYVKIGTNIFEVLKPCTRCIVTTIDPETGVRNPKTEPLEVLRSYRMSSDPQERGTSGNSPRMGLQLALRSSPGGIVSINDNVYVSYRS